MMKPRGIGFEAGRVLGALLLGLVAVPDRSSAAAEAPASVDFRGQVRPILSDACFGCHGPDPETRKAKLRLDVRDGGAFGDRDGGRVIEPGKPEESELISRITSDDPGEKMPPRKHPRQLKPAEVTLLTRWVAEGAEWREHWSLVPPGRPSPPGVKEAPWCRNGIDNFILARLEAEGLSPSPEADRRTLIRRLSLDLTGLPPTPKEVEAFQADPAPDAYEKLADRLLGSPRYGERMAVDWLDATRYADTNGYQVDRDREMWPWRDWVIDAFNRNLPFDQFTIEQLAGDLLPDPTLSQRVATGLHRNTMLNEEGGIIPEEFLAEYVSDRVETTSTVWLGLTVGCARCHDHKFDPISQKDFYGLYAFFHNVPETGLGNFGAESKLSAPPLLALPTPEQQRDLDRNSAEIRGIEGQLGGPSPELAAEQAAWEAALSPEHASTWIVLDPSALRAKGGTSLTEQPDGVILAEGPNPPSETYEIEASTALRGIKGIRLEVFPDDRLPAKGPGRGVNGNFVLTEVRMRAGEVPLKIRAATADFSQENYGIAAAIDGDPLTGWAIHPEIGKPHAAVFELQEAVEGVAGGTIPLAFTLDFRSSSAQHQVGKFRLSVTAAREPSKLVPLPPSVVPILAVPAGGSGRHPDSGVAEILPRTGLSDRQAME